MGGATPTENDAGARRTNLFRRYPTAAFYTLLIAATALMLVAWNWRAGARLDEVRRQFAARGEPATVADLTVPDVSPEQNAWPLLMSAAAAITVESPTNGNTVYPETPPFGEAWERVAEVSSKSNTKALGLLRDARSRSRLIMRESWPKPAFNSFFAGGLGQVREICNLAGDDALYQHVRGNHVAAVERVLDMTHVAKLMQQEPTLLGQLISMGLWALAEARIAVIAPGLPANDPEVRRLMRQLIAELLDEESARRDFAAVWGVENAMTAELIETIAGDVWALRPLKNQTLADTAAANLAIASLVTERSAPAAMRRFDRLDLPMPVDDPELTLFSVGPRKPRQLPNYSRWFGMLATDQTLRRTVGVQYRALAERRTTALIVTLQLYRADHGGQWPATLAELAPHYLPAIPSDPFHEDGRAIGYVILRGALPDGGDRPLVYFDVGPDHSEAIDTEPMIGWQSSRADSDPEVFIRQYRDVARWSPKVRRIDAEIEAERLQELERQREQKEIERLEKEEAERSAREPTS